MQEDAHAAAEHKNTKQKTDKKKHDNHLLYGERP